MILDELVLHNFGVYRGRQTLDLTPPSEDEPIILIGGMNGGGKTTFLDAIQLVLYGKRAKCSNRGSMAYTDFLEECIHRGIPQTEGAALELEFRHPFEGEEQTIRVHRSWYPTEKSVTEKVTVHRNGKKDPVMTETWDDFVEEFMPLGISDLFFFDGEKIKRFANIDSSSKLLETAVHTLLGLDVVDQLGTDLKALERRKTTEGHSEKEKEKIREADDEKERIENQLAEVNDELGSLNTELTRAKKKLDAVEEEYRVEGGNLYDRRNELEAEYKELQSEIDELEDEMREIAKGCAPLLLVRDQLEEIAEQDRREQQAHRAEILSETLEERDQKVLEEVEEREGQSELYESLRDILAEDRQKHTEEQEVDRYLNMDESGRHQLKVLLRSQLDDTQATIDEKLAEMDTLLEEKVRLERQIGAIPEEDAIAELIEERERLRDIIQEAEARKEELWEERQRLNERHEEAEQRLERRYEDLAKAEFENRDTNRLLEHSTEVRDTLQVFRDRIIRRHIDRIESTVLDSFQKLLRKQDLIDDLDIDPETFELQLWDGNENPVSPERLSAGERQLLAVSLLWGLARASGRPLPTVIDTPLGRLDSSHRGHLIERYFPFASHQVILLSTDEEIGERYYERIKPAVGREYTLAHNDAQNATTVEDGYNIIGGRDVA